MQDMPIAPRVWQHPAPFLLKQSHAALAIHCQGSFGGRTPACYRVRALTHQKQDGKEIGLWHQQCSASVLGKCGPDVLPCLRQILLLFTFAPSSNVQLSGMSMTRERGGITWLLNAWNDVKHFAVNWVLKKDFSSDWVGFLLTIVLQGKVLTPL